MPSPNHPSPRLIIFDFDGTLFDTHDSIAHCIALTFATLTPETPAPDIADIRRAIGTGAGLEDTFRMLGACDSPESAAPWITEYRKQYAVKGIPLISAFPHARALLEKLKEAGIVSVVVSNKGVQAVKDVLANNLMDELVEGAFGDVPGVPKKPDPAVYHRFVAPMFEGKGGISGEDVLVVGDTEADIKFARNIGAKVCWVRYGYGDRDKCEELKPDLVVYGLKELEWLLLVARD